MSQDQQYQSGSRQTHSSGYSSNSPYYTQANKYNSQPPNQSMNSIQHNYRTYTQADQPNFISTPSEKSRYSPAGITQPQQDALLNPQMAQLNVQPSPKNNRNPGEPPPIYTPSSQYSTSDQEYLSEVLAFTQTTIPPPSHPNPNPIQNPIAIPQRKPGIGQPFLRAWPPELQSHGFTPTDFLAFIDNLNIVSTASPPLQVLNLAGTFLGYVPHHWAQLAGLGIQATAQLGTAAVSKGRTEMFMKEVNERVFRPRGLKVSLAATNAVREVLRVPQSKALLEPLTEEIMEMNFVERVLLSIGPYNSVLDLDVPPVAKQTTVMGRLSAKQVEMGEAKERKKMVKEREKAVEKEAKRGAKRDKSKERKEKRARSKERKHAKKDRKNNGRDDARVTSGDGAGEFILVDGIQYKRTSGASATSGTSAATSDISERRESNSERGRNPDKKSGKRKDKEVKSVDKLLWILIESL